MNRLVLAAQLVELALDEYQLGMSDEEEPYGVRAAQPHIAMLLRGGRTGLRAELARRYFDQTGAVAAQQALADATNVLEGLAAQEQPTRLFQRVAADSPNAYVDLGDTDGTVIEIGPTGWQLTNTAPVVFARTKLTAPAPRPVPGGNLADLWDFVNIAEEDRPVLLAVMVQALIQIDVPHPVLALFAEQGSAKSSTARVLVDLAAPRPVRGTFGAGQLAVVLGRVFEQVPPTRQRKKYAKHSDRILKKLPVNERRRQMQMRRSIEQEIDFA